MNDVRGYEGKIFFAREGENIVGMVVVINNVGWKNLWFFCCKEGRVIELVVSNKCHLNGIGKLLLNKMETYFINVGCKGSLIDVLMYNEIICNLEM